MIKFEQASTLKKKPDFANLAFGRHFTDYMFVMDYSQEAGWHNARITPYGNLQLDPATTVFHYSQSVFEGLKAYKTEDGFSLFRPSDNFARLNRSCDRLCIPRFDEALALEGMLSLLRRDLSWVPEGDDTALYIRPTIIGTDVQIGLSSSKSYKFFIVLSPVGPYYAHGMQPVKIFVEHKYVRAAVGGTGEAKCGANYAIALKASEEAAQKGFDQVLWLDAAERRYVEEVGSMNIFFVIDGVVVTPELSGSILPGITRDSAIKLFAANGMAVQERRITVDEVLGGIDSGRLTECFGTGTAAVVSPVGWLHDCGIERVVGGGSMGKVTQWLYQNLTGIQKKRLPDPFGWVKDII